MTQSKQWSPSDIVPAESDETESQKRRGRIPQSAWPGILERYKAGATLSALAREFNCTPSAISYIVRKAEAATGSEGETGDGEGRPEENTKMSNQSDADASGAAPESAPAPQSEARAPQPEARSEAPPRPPESRQPEPRPERSEQRGERAEQGRGEPRESRQNQQRPPQEGRAPNFTDPRRAAQQGGQQNMRLQLPTGGPAAQQHQPAFTPPAGDSPYRHQQRNPAREESVEAPQSPPDQRMTEAATAAADAYRKWKAGSGEEGMQTLADALHDLRKVIARMEIEISASRREEHAARPIPIPMHRAAQRS